MKTFIFIIRLLLIFAFVSIVIAVMQLDACQREELGFWRLGLCLTSVAVLAYCLALKIIKVRGYEFNNAIEDVIAENFTLGLLLAELVFCCIFCISMGVVEKFSPYNGISIVCNSTIKAKSIIGGKGKNLLRYELEYNNIFSSIASHDDYQLGEKIYIKQPLLCNIEAKQYYFSRKDPEILDFGFYDGTNLFTYHDYSLKNPDLVYCHVGFSVICKAILDSIGSLRFTDINCNQCSIKYSPKNYTSIPDTFLVFRNINEAIDDRFIVCAPEVNTPENWSKISDYGYIFHFDVYSKEEIESQCPQIRNYVEKYKERMKTK